MVSRNADESWFSQDHWRRTTERKAIANGEKVQTGMMRDLPSITLQMPIRKALLDAATSTRKVDFPASQSNDAGLGISNMQSHPVDTLMEKLGDTPDVPSEPGYAWHGSQRDNRPKKPGLFKQALDWLKKQLWK